MVSLEDSQKDETLALPPKNKFAEDEVVYVHVRTVNDIFREIIGLVLLTGRTLNA